MWVLKQGTKILKTGTWEECYEKLCKLAFKNDGMTLVKKVGKGVH